MSTFGGWGIPNLSIFGVIEKVAMMEAITANSVCSARCLPGQILNIASLSEIDVSTIGGHSPSSKAKHHCLRIADGLVELIFSVVRALEEALWTKLLWLGILFWIVED